MTEGVTIEDLQTKILELEKKLEEQTTIGTANAEKLKETEASLQKSRDLNAVLMTKVPGADATPASEPELSDEDFLIEAIAKIVDDAKPSKKE